MRIHRTRQVQALIPPPKPISTLTGQMTYRQRNGHWTNGNGNGQHVIREVQIVSWRDL
jgi:hypothetical protein